MLLPLLTTTDGHKHHIKVLHCYTNKSAFWLNSNAVSSLIIDFGVKVGNISLIALVVPKISLMLPPPLTTAEANKHLIIEFHCYTNKSAFWMNSKAYSSRMIDFGVKSMQQFGMYTSCA